MLKAQNHNAGAAIDRWRENPALECGRASYRFSFALKLSAGLIANMEKRQLRGRTPKRFAQDQSTNGLQ
jgi:hypothetical protein